MTPPWALRDLCHVQLNHGSPRWVSFNHSKLIVEIDQARSLGTRMLGVVHAGGISPGPIPGTTQLEPSSLPQESFLLRACSTSCDKDCDSHRQWELHCCGSMKRDPPQGIPAQQPSSHLEAQSTDGHLAVSMFLLGASNLRHTTACVVYSLHLSIIVRALNNFSQFRSY